IIYEKKRSPNSDVWASFKKSQLNSGKMFNIPEKVTSIMEIGLLSFFLPSPVYHPVNCSLFLYKTKNKIKIPIAADQTLEPFRERLLMIIQAKALNRIIKTIIRNNSNNTLIFQGLHSDCNNRL